MIFSIKTKKNKAMSNINFQQIISSLFLSVFGIYSRDGPFSTDLGLVNLHPAKEAHWDAYIGHKYIGSYGCSFPPKPSSFILKRNRH